MRTEARKFLTIPKDWNNFEQATTKECENHEKINITIIAFNINVTIGFRI